MRIAQIGISRTKYIDTALISTRVQSRLVQLPPALNSKGSVHLSHRPGELVLLKMLTMLRGVEAKANVTDEDHKGLMKRFSSLLQSPSQPKSSQPQDQDQALVALPSSTELDIPQYQRSTTLGPPEKAPVRSKPLPLCSGVLTSELQRKSTEVNDLKHTKSTLEKH